MLILLVLRGIFGNSLSKKIEKFELFNFQKKKSKSFQIQRLKKIQIFLSKKLHPREFQLNSFLSYLSAPFFCNWKLLNWKQFIVCLYSHAYLILFDWNIKFYYHDHAKSCIIREAIIFQFHNLAKEHASTITHVQTVPKQLTSNYCCPEWWIYRPVKDRR